MDIEYVPYHLIGQALSMQLLYSRKERGWVAEWLILVLAVPTAIQIALRPPFVIFQIHYGNTVPQ